MEELNKTAVVSNYPNLGNREMFDCMKRVNTNP